MLTREQIAERLADRNLAEVSRRTGVSYGTLLNVAAGRTSPSYLTRRALTDYLLHGVEAEPTEPR